MLYDTLTDFITTKMRMSHIYQPVMLLLICFAHGGVGCAFTVPFAQTATDR